MQPQLSDTPREPTVPNIWPLRACPGKYQCVKGVRIPYDRTLPCAVCLRHGFPSCWIRVAHIHLNLSSSGAPITVLGGTALRPAGEPGAFCSPWLCCSACFASFLLPPLFLVCYQLLLVANTVPTKVLLVVYCGLGNTWKLSLWGVKIVRIVGERGRTGGFSCKETVTFRT